MVILHNVRARFLSNMPTRPFLSYRKIDTLPIEFSTDLRAVFQQLVENLGKIDTFLGKSPWHKAFLRRVFNRTGLLKS